CIFSYRVIESDLPFLGAAEHEGGRENLGDAIKRKGRIGSRGNGPIDTLPSERALPGTVGLADDRRSQAGNAALCAESVNVVAKTVQQQIVGACGYRRRKQGENGRENEAQPTH